MIAGISKSALRMSTRFPFTVARHPGSHGRVKYTTASAAHRDVSTIAELRSRASTAKLRDCRHVADRKSTRLNSSHVEISYAVFCLKKKKKHKTTRQTS